MPAAEVGIVGGGVLGMTLAARLRQQGHQVTLFEAGPQPGGLAAADQIGDYSWDRFYHVILLSDQYLRGLLTELGLEDHLQWGQTRTGFYGNGRLHSLSSSLEFLRFPLLNLADKARLAATIIRASRIRDPEPLESIPCLEWLARWSGPRVTERIWLPLLRSKLGDNADQASAAFIWAIIARMYAARRSGLKREMFGYVEGGYRTVLARFGEWLDELGVEVKCGARVSAVTETGSAARIVLADGTSREFDRVVLTIPAGRIASLCPQLNGSERARLERVVYQGVVCPSLLLRRPLGPYYVTNLVDPGLPFTGVIEMTALVDRSNFGGNALVYLPHYLTQSDPRWRASDDEFVSTSIDALERIYPDFRRSDVLATRVGRVREVLAVATLNYSRDALPPVGTSLPHVAIINSAQIVNGTLNVNETIALAESGARTLGAELREQGRMAVEINA
jgi:protoporphyrinogen oxidase